MQNVPPERKCWLHLIIGTIRMSLNWKEILATNRVGKITSVDFHWYHQNVFHGADYFRRWHSFINKADRSGCIKPRIISTCSIGWSILIPWRSWPMVSKIITVRIVPSGQNLQGLWTYQGLQILFWYQQDSKYVELYVKTNNTMAIIATVVYSGKRSISGIKCQLRLFMPMESPSIIPWLRTHPMKAGEYRLTEWMVASIAGGRYTLSMANATAAIDQNAKHAAEMAQVKDEKPSPMMRSGSWIILHKRWVYLCPQIHYRPWWRW